MFVDNPNLNTIRPGWPGTPVDTQGRFVNHEFPFHQNLSDVLRWKLGPKPQKKEKLTDSYRPGRDLSLKFLSQTSDCIVWLGHASFYIQLSGVRMLIDPVFYDVPFVKRYAEHAASPRDFTNLDYLLVSHDHLDHCQKQSVQEIIDRNPSVEILTGLKMDTLLSRWTKGQTIQCSGWYQQFNTRDEVSISFLPTRHWAKRGVWDTNKRLWGCFVLQSKAKTIYFGGDTGYGSHFKDASVLFPTIDVAVIGTGAYNPEWFMAPNHMAPKDAVIAANELQAKVMIPMHYATFDLSDEPAGEPIRLLERLNAERALHARLAILKLGECFTNF